ncbi:MAG: F0F1 ATP synthase subunit B family protein [Hyphomicrobium sp.]
MHAPFLALAGLPQLNTDHFAPQLFWLALTFGVLYYIMSRIALPRVGEVIEERRDRIQRDLDAAERLKGETEKALAGYEKALSDARGNAAGIAKETRERLAGEVDKEKSKVDAVIAAKLVDAETRISATKVKALASVGDIATETAGAVLSKLINQTVSADEIRKALASGATK